MLKLSHNGKYDVAIIGGGVGGLTASALLSKAGLKVCVIEKEPHVGGYLAGFRRKDFRFDTAIHWLNQCGPNGLVTRVFQLLGNDFPQPRPLTYIRRYKGVETDYMLTNNPDELKEQLIKEYPEDEKGIHRFFKAAKRLGHSFANLNSIFRTEETMTFSERAANKIALIKFALPFIPFISYTGEEGFKKGMAKYFSNPNILKIFSAESDLLSCLVPIGWAYYGDYQTPPEGGGQRIPEWLEHVSKYFGADIFCRTEVKEILLEGDTCKGIRCINRKEEYHIESKYIIAACDLQVLYHKLLPPHAIPQRIKDKLATAEMYDSSFTVSIALNCPTEQLGFGEEMVHLHREGIRKEEHYSADPEKCSVTILAPSAKDKSLAPKGNGTMVLFMPAKMNDYNYWGAGSEERLANERDADYEALKISIAEKLIDRIAETMVPHLREHIIFYDAATPITHWRYTWNMGGTMMGTKPGRKNMQGKVATYKTAVKNLFIGGHWAELGGGVPIAVKAGANASLFILKEERPTLYQTIAKYMDDRASLQDVLNHSDLGSYEDTWERRPTPAENMAKRASSKEFL